MTDEELVAALTDALGAAAHWCQHERCTTCQVISDEDFDAQIGAMAMHGSTPTWVEGKPVAFATALLPTVRRIAEQRAAEELRYRAAGITDRATEADDQDVQSALDDEAARLNACAAALTATPEHGTDTTT